MVGGARMTTVQFIIFLIVQIFIPFIVIFFYLRFFRKVHIQPGDTTDKKSEAGIRQETDLLFQIFEEADRLFYEFRNPDPNFVGYNYSSRYARNNYLKNINKMMSSVISKKYRLSAFFNTDDDIPQQLELLISPLVKAYTSLNKVNAEIYRMERTLTKEKACSFTNGEVRIFDSGKVNACLESASRLFYSHTDYVYMLNRDYEEAKQQYLSSINNYLDQIKNNTEEYKSEEKEN